MMLVRRWIPAALLTVGLIASGSVTTTIAAWTDSANVAGNTFSTATLQPPTGLNAVASCQGLGTARITLTWTAAALADGYDIYQSTTSGGPYSFIAHVTGGSSTSYTNNGLQTNRTYYFVLKSTRNAWVSANSAQAQVTTPLLCL